MGTFPDISRRALARLGLALSASLALRPAIAAEEDMIFESGVMVRMRDGVRLATDIYRPAKNGKPLPGAFPVILERTPYGRNVVSRSELSLAEPVAKSRAAGLCGDLSGLPRPLWLRGRLRQISQRRRRRL
jgi:predicted acyl esterase